MFNYTKRLARQHKMEAGMDLADIARTLIHTWLLCLAAFSCAFVAGMCVMAVLAAAGVTL